MATFEALPKVLVLVGPSGVGKTMLQEKLSVLLKPPTRKLVTTTTRSPRPGEVDGRDYHFTSLGEFEAMVADGMFLEHQAYGRHKYGSTETALLDATEDGAICIAVLGCDGVKAYQKLRDKYIDLRVVAVTAPAAIVAQRLGDDNARAKRDTEVDDMQSLGPDRVLCNDATPVEALASLVAYLSSEFMV